ncbi:creatininase family protein (plasmid) [Leisingera sp. M527]|uniref:creatininase family protein n=1 Tax=Leisingera sp. M527 TaxID=2867014 RepID=UPI0021A355AD|nr:creatininase family protein [Leisingera sp. M527]UWQ35552.1 creatininase family protein [Leisingera sp. M527]
MQLAHMTWQQVEARLKAGAAVMVPVGSTEQHGPMGMIGTDTICAEAVALRAAELCDAIVAPALAYTPAPFNTAFPGTVSMPEDLFQAHATAVFRGLLAQGFSGVFIVNGHGANLAPLQRAAQELAPGRVAVRSWWEPQEVKEMRKDLYGDWEGMHATPSEVAITQALLGVLPAGEAAEPPQKLSAEFIKAHAGDRHGPPEEHRAEFPDGRVGSHSALANPQDGARLLEAAARGICEDFQAFAEAAEPKIS